MAGTPGEVTLKLRALLDADLSSADDPQRIHIPPWVGMPWSRTHSVGGFSSVFIHPHAVLLVGVAGRIVGGEFLLSCPADTSVHMQYAYTETVMEV